jgi:S1-C subfamily serine protease
LQHLSGARRGQVEAFRKAYIGLGRHPLSDVRFDAERDLDVSARHAAIVDRDGTFYLQDLGSRNGTLLNGRPVTEETALTDGDVIGFGPDGPTVEFRAVPDDDALDARGAEGLAQRSSRPRDAIPAVSTPPRRAGTAVRIALEVARQTRHLRATTKVLIGALAVSVGAFAGLQWAGTRARTRDVASLAARADSLSRSARELAVRFEGEVQALRHALLDAQAETARLQRELRTVTGGDAGTVARLRAELEAAAQRQSALASATAMNYHTIAAQNQDAVALVLVEFSPTERFSGTAFAVDSLGILVTNRHVLAGEDGARRPRRVGVMFAGSRQNFPAEIVGLSSEADLAVLRVQIAGGVPRVGALARDRAGLARGDPVAVLGYPLGFDLPMSRVGTAPVAEPTLTIGTVSKTLDDVLQLDGYGAPGSSGSPVFDGAGRVVGMVFGGERAAQGKIVYALPAAVIARYLRQLGIDVE